MNKQEKTIYFAGFFDGEGYLGYGFDGRTEVRICNTYLPVLKQLKKSYGGGIYQRKKTPKRHKQAYDWIITGKDDVRNFLTDIKPFLIEKKEKIESFMLT